MFILIGLLSISHKTPPLLLYIYQLQIMCPLQTACALQQQATKALVPVINLPTCTGTPPNSALRQMRCSAAREAEGRYVNYLCMYVCTSVREEAAVCGIHMQLECFPILPTHLFLRQFHKLLPLQNVTLHTTQSGVVLLHQGILSCRAEEGVGVDRGGRHACLCVLVSVFPHTVTGRAALFTRQG